MPIASLPKTVSFEFPKVFQDKLDRFDAADPAGKKEMIDSAVRDMNADLNRRFVLFINDKQFSRRAHEQQWMPSWQRIAGKICAVLLRLTLIFANLGNRLWKSIEERQKRDQALVFQQAELAKQHLESLGLSQRNIYILLDHCHQGFYAYLMAPITPKQYGCNKESPEPPFQIAPRVSDKGISSTFFLRVKADKTATLSSASTVDIVEGISPHAPNSASKLLQTNKVRLQLTVGNDLLAPLSLHDETSQPLFYKFLKLLRIIR